MPTPCTGKTKPGRRIRRVYAARVYAGDNAEFLQSPRREHPGTRGQATWVGTVGGARPWLDGRPFRGVIGRRRARADGCRIGESRSRSRVPRGGLAAGGAYRHGITGRYPVFPSSRGGKGPRLPGAALTP